MLNIRKIISRYMQMIALLIVSVIFVLALVLQILNEQRQARANAGDMFGRMEKLLESNQQDLEETKAEYTQTCVHNAQVAAYIIQYHSEVLDSVDELRKIAEYIEVDEIHIFDKTGRIFTGTHPEYYDMTFDSGEQIGFFKPLLQDKTLELCQEITPNTAEAKPMQYSALWSENGEFIVQVGMEPVNVMKITEKNELSYIFAFLRINPEVSYYAVDMESGEVVGATETETVGRKADEIGLAPDILRKHGEDGFQARVNGVDSYCVFTQLDDKLIGRVVANDVLYRRIATNMIVLLIGLILVSTIMVRAVTRYMNTYVVDGIYSINEKLRMISQGNFSARIDVHSSMEFSELSEHMNEMIRSLLANTEKISYILNRTNMNIGVYEYYKNAKNVRFTEFVGDLLGVEKKEGGQLSLELDAFHLHMAKLKEHPVYGEEGVYLLQGEKEQYIKIEENSQDDDIYGVIADITDDMERRRQIEAERDEDLLTGLYNRRAMENQLSELFWTPEKLGYGALVMLDADGLKEINDKYGHEKGDIYLKKIADVISSFGMKSGIAARWGGDEFILFLYRYESGKEVTDMMENLEYLQNNSSAYLNNELSVPLKFSFGYSLIRGKKDYQELLKQADERMYTNKRTRKSVIRDEGYGDDQ